MGRKGTGGICAYIKSKQQNTGGGISSISYLPGAVTTAAGGQAAERPRAHPFPKPGPPVLKGGTHQASLFPPGISDGPYRAPSSPPLTPLPTNKIPLALRSRHRLYMGEKGLVTLPQSKFLPVNKRRGDKYGEGATQGSEETQSLKKWDPLGLGVNRNIRPDRCGSGGWVSSHRAKGYQFGSQSGHMPGLQAWSPVKTRARGN